VREGVARFPGFIALGSGGITKLQGGKWVLSGSNTYDGATNISAGTLVAASDSALGSSLGATTVASGATLGIPGRHQLRYCGTT
jgi:autotransporter-associated beta strand protein